jgi:hypothetical protein
MGLGKRDLVLQPCATQCGGRLFELNLEEDRRAAFEAQWGPADDSKAGTFLCVPQRKSQKEQNESDPGVDFHLLSIEPVALARER